MSISIKVFVMSLDDCFNYLLKGNIFGLVPVAFVCVSVFSCIVGGSLALVLFGVDGKGTFKLSD